MKVNINLSLIDKLILTFALSCAILIFVNDSEREIEKKGKFKVIEFGRRMLLYEVKSVGEIY